MKIATRILLLVLGVLLGAALTMVVFLYPRGMVSVAAADKLDELKSVLDTYFVEDVDIAALEEAAAAAMVNSLGDRWSHYLSAEEFGAYQQTMANAYVGIGITIIQQEDGSIEIVSVEKSGPAYEAGLRPGDVITAVAGKTIQNMSTDEVGNLVRGEEGTEVDITYRRGGTATTVPVMRRMIQVTVASGQMLEGNVGLVTIENFDNRCAAETITAIRQLEAQGARALIFDVRNNPGGYKAELVEILDYLLPEGPLFRSELYNGTTTVDSSNAECLELPMMVLVNGDSFSAAEFFAAALSEYGVAEVVGLPTVGKGYFQYTLELSDGSAVVLSTGKYYTPNGVSLAGVGLTPDILVEVDGQTYADIYYGNVAPQDDPQIQAALEALKTE